MLGGVGPAHRAHHRPRTVEQARTSLASTNPQGRFIQPKEVAAAVLWLCSEAAGSVTGQALSLSGGETW